MKVYFFQGFILPVKTGKRWTAKVVLDSMLRDLKICNLYAGEKAHSFRHGGTVDSLKRLGTNNVLSIHEECKYSMLKV
jgi:hypothetical protein